ncbi:GNAT family N-acetyltransferase [Methylomicrobium sp. Wu6]|uniref:GNAT family N-acetyltransferase n=1 Tax=Methylomicrobium sp. Wu6 TaxID=3107928 RepID=UPI002DD658FB|nr:GNAT family N-acetyltransferase [Methylomicrobium sp. Wu6]MEC4746887.1 GNAT family N-acetyltransferase [Methylomicrobium sp. Wu6]
MQVKQICSVAEITASEWNTLAGRDYPFIRHEFLAALEKSGSVSEKTGWLPRHLLVYDQEELVALLPLYLKSHSFGEYVFDQQWAAAYRQHGLAYYPKALTAIPFTPCPGTRLVLKNSADQANVMRFLFDWIQDMSIERGISSWHCLFPVDRQAEQWQVLGLLLREAVQFHWFNKGYRDFDDYLDAFNAAKRKMIKRERCRVNGAGIELRRVPGDRVSEAEWQIFYRFYTLTYLKNASQPYLASDFFTRCAAAMGECMMLTLAIKHGETVAAALSFIGGDTLYGRYWGCAEEQDALHFEACYYQGLDYCIEHGLKRFDSGAQGEHKIARGFEPVSTYSAHWLKDAGFAEAVEKFLMHERRAVNAYRQNAVNYLPFKK